jgi:hypothetical protein
MTAREIRGILAHEIVHLRNGDFAPMQLALVVRHLTRTMSQIAFLGVFFSLLVTTCFASPMAPGPAMRIAGQFGGFEIGLALASVRQLSLGPLLVLAVAPLGGGLLAARPLGDQQRIRGASSSPASASRGCGIASKPWLPGIRAAAHLALL